MNDITHRHTTAPLYERQYFEGQNQWDKYDLAHSGEWDYPEDHSHHIPKPERFEYYPVVFDIESSASTKQLPTLCIAYDSYEHVLLVAYRQGYERTVLEKDDIMHLADDFTKRGYPVDSVELSHTVGRKWVEANLIQRVVNSDVPKCLCAHNAFFDLGMLGEPDDGLLETDHVKSNETDGAVKYNDISMAFKRAGQAGRLYTFVNSNTGDHLSVNVADTMVAAKAMWVPPRLEDACEYFNISYTDNEVEHGSLDMDYIGYCADDVAATMELYDALDKKLREDFQAEMNIHNVFSTASITKNVFARMNYDRVAYTHEASKLCSKSFYGGQTEAIKTDELMEGVTYMDLMSQYPTASALTGVWQYMRMDEVDAVEISPDELPDFTAEDIRQPETWPELRDYYVVLKADDAMLPVRTKLNTKDDGRAGTTKVYNVRATHSEGEATTHHYYDYVAACLHAEVNDTSKPDIVKAYKVVGEGDQTPDLEETEVGGTTIKPEDDVLQKLIEERKDIQKRVGGKNEETKAMKITANGGYGCTAERLVKEVGDKEEKAYIKKDTAGKYFSPHVASTITSAGRLMLALGEHAARKAGGELLYCDTDSLVVPDEVTDATREAFENLNPYDGHAGTLDVLEIEEEDGVTLENVNMYVVGEKKYCVLNQDMEVIYWKEHGLGHYSWFRSNDCTDECPDDIEDCPDHEPRAKQFWGSLLHMQGVDIPNSHPALSRGQKETLVRWQETASTQNVRESIQRLLKVDGFRYGDWVEKTVFTNYDRQRVLYVGLDLDREAIQVKEQEDGSVTAQRVSMGDVDRRDQKTIGDVLSDWHVTASVAPKARTRMRIVAQEIVDKESSSVSEELERVVQDMLAKVDWDLFQ